ncbi:hypothetical protein [Streptomyces yanii]|uniref:hypothetical protein n=1 Tax=Streptomyces yanii TaxID=78510 RepID=UPI00336EFE12
MQTSLPAAKAEAKKQMGDAHDRAMPQEAPDWRGTSTPQAPSPREQATDQLYTDAKRRNVEGRSHMDKAELQRVLGRS